MVAMRNYVVTRSQEVTVQATSPAEAANVGNLAFQGITTTSIPFSERYIKQVRDTELSAREEY